mmetsp:Transcript_100420/g.183203  ORF Transcript_100420/g.183203 Transcript_100420/m.183203 type:complete len:1116 (+) Transcript_100420:87-3434(+)
MAEIVETLRSLLSGDNARRSAAEQQYESLKKEQPQALVSLLFQVLLQPDLEQPVREQAAVLLRQCLGQVNKDGSIWSRLGGDAAQRDVLAKLLQLLEAEPADKIRRKVADCIQTLGNQLIDIEDDARPKNAEQWPDLMPTLMRIIMDSSKAPGFRSDALWAVKEMACSIWQVLVASTEQTLQVMRFCLADAAELVRANAACMVCEVIGYVENKQQRAQFLPLMPEIFTIISQLASGSDSTQLKTVFQALLITTEESADCYREYVASHVLPVLCPIANKHADAEVKRMALEVLCSLLESKPKMMLKVPNCLGAIFEVCVNFLMELDDDLEAWAARDAGDKEEEQHDFGAEVIDRVCTTLRKVEVFDSVGLSTLQPAIAQLFQQSEWKPVVAGLSILRQIMEHVEEEETLGQMITAVKMQLQATHARVRNAAWQCLEQFSKDHEQQVSSDEWSAQLLPEFVKGLDDPCSPNVLACMSAFQHFGEHVERENLEPFVQTLMERLGQKLQSSQALQRESITFIAVIAGQIQDAFAQYYAPLMPVLKKVIADTVHKVEERVLLGKAFECISLLATAVGKDTFRPDAEVIMESMIRATQVPDLPADDPVKEYMMAAAERICSVLREDFLPFVPHLLPGVLSMLQLKPKEYDEVEAQLDPDNLSIAVVPGDDGEAKILVMSNSELEDVQHAVECIHTFVEKLGQRYAPFVAQTAQALLPVFEFDMREEVREMAFETWGQLCHGAREAGQAQVVSELVGEFMKRIIPKLEAPVVDPEAVKTRVDGVRACLKEAGPGILGNEQVRHICQLMIKLVGDSFMRRDGAAGKSKKDAAVADEDEDTDAEEDASEEEEALLRQAACNCATGIMEHHADLFLTEGLPLYLPLIEQLLQTSGSSEDHQLGLYAVSSLFEHLGERVVPHWPAFLPQLFQDIVSEKGDIRAAACYAVSFAARQSAFSAHAGETATRLAEVISRTRAAKSKKKSDKLQQMAADNALSALMEILLHHEGTVEAGKTELWGAWVAGLPCQEDNDEGVRNHGTLLQLVQKEKPEVVGAGGAHIPKLLAVLVDIYKTEMADDITSWGIGRLLVKVGQTQLETFAASFSEKQKKKLLRAYREAQRGSAAA